MAYSVLFLLGIALGSFLNVLILRYKPGGAFSWRSFSGRSHCDHCGIQLHWHELIPLISFFIQGGKCRRCHKKLTWQYPIVELSMGSLASGIGYLFLSTAPYSSTYMMWVRYTGIGIWIAVSMALVYAFFIDLYYRIIPNGTNVFLMGLGVLWTAVLTWSQPKELFGYGSFLGSYSQLWQWNSVWVNHVVGMMVGALFFLIIVIVSRGKGMGMGDVKLMTALGLLFGWFDIGIIIMASFIIGTIIILPLLFTHKARGKDMIPFGPFIVLASFVMLFWGAGLLQTYFGIIERLGGILG